MHIAYLGLGNMGSYIAANLAKHAAENGSKLTVWNRSQDKYDGLRDLIKPAEFATDLQQIADADVIFVMVLNDAASQDMLAKILAVAKKGAVVLEQSSINPKTSIANAKTAEAAGVSYLAGTVFGRPDAAEAGKLIQVVSGDAAAKEKVKPLFGCISRAVLDVGPEVEKAAALKLMGNALILGVIEMLAETYALGDAVGIDPDVFQQFIDLFFPTPSYNVYGRKVGHGSFDSKGGFRLEGGIKDANNILNVGGDLGHPVNLPTIKLAKEHMERAAELGGKDLDWSSLSAAVREKADLPPFRKAD